MRNSRTGEMSGLEKKKKPTTESRWNLHHERWEIRRASQGERGKGKKGSYKPPGAWEHDTDKKPSEYDQHQFIRSSIDSSSYADVSRDLGWSLKRVKAVRARINNQLKKMGPNPATGSAFQLPKLDDYSETQLRTKTAQKREGFQLTPVDTLSALFMTQEQKKAAKDKS